MPLPKPTDEETEDEFIERCMSDEGMLEEYPENDQRAAVCYSQWRRSKESETMEHKSTIVELKAEKEGTFVARIATLNVIDRDGDVTVPGAFPDGKTVLVSAYQHGSWGGRLPVGKAVIRESEDEVLADGEFNLNTESGREHYQAIKFSPELQEWSYGFDIKDSELGTFEGKDVRFLKKVEPYEISPVLLGAGIGTATLSVKSQQKGVITFASAHSGGTAKAPEDADWDAGKEMREAEIDDLKVMCTWVDSENSDTKGAYKLPHHRASGGHSVVWRAVAAAMAALLGARGGVDIPASDKKGVYGHLKKHYGEFDKEPPELREYGGETYLNQAETTLAAVTELIDRTKSLADLRRKEGRELSSANRERMKQLLDALTNAAADIKDLVDATESQADKDLRSYLLGLKEKLIDKERQLNNENTNTIN